MQPVPENRRHRVCCRILTGCVLLLLTLASCAVTSVPDMNRLNQKWQGKPFRTLIDRLGSPHRTTLHPDGEKQAFYIYREHPVFNTIFRGEFSDEMSTIRIQEELAREEQSKCVLEVFVRQNTIIRLDATGLGCRDIRDKLERP